MLTRLIGRVLTNALGFAAVALVVIAFAIPQVGVIWNPAAEAALATLDTECPVGTSVQADPTYYYGCVSTEPGGPSPWCLGSRTERRRNGTSRGARARDLRGESPAPRTAATRIRRHAGDNDRVHPDAVEAADVSSQA